MSKNLLPISKNGLPKIVSAVIALLIFVMLDFDIMSLLTSALVLFFIYAYRNPERENITYESKSVVSPVDGVVLSVENLDSSEYAYRVEIDSTCSDVGLLRVPITAKIKEITSVHGSRLSQKEQLFRELNEKSSITFEDSLLNKIKVEHLLKQSIDPISIDAYSEQNFVQNARYGFMLNGITTLYLPHNFRLNISVGNRVVSSQTLVGYFS